MRFRTLTLLACLILPAAARAQSWESFSYPQHGFSVHFPAKPQVAKGSYKPLSGAVVPATIYSARDGAVSYAITVAEFAGKSLDKDAVIGDAVKLATGDAQVRADVEARINSQYGRELSLKRKDGSVAILAVFFFNNRLYLLEGGAPSANAEEGASRGVRFQQSLEFNGG